MGRDGAGRRTTADGVGVELEDEEWYVLCNWLHEGENRLMYAHGWGRRRWGPLRSIRLAIESQLTDEPFPVVRLDRWEWDVLCSHLDRRRRRLLLRPWRDKERREVRNLSDHVRAQL